MNPEKERPEKHEENMTLRYVPINNSWFRRLQFIINWVEFNTAVATDTDGKKHNVVIHATNLLKMLKRTKIRGYELQKRKT